MKKTIIYTSVLASALACSFLKADDNFYMPEIVNGEEADKNEFPWMASVQFSGQHDCGGSLVAEGWILTAAHCAANYKSGQVSTRYKPGNVTVKLGAHDQRDNTGVSIYQVEKVLVHPKYRVAADGSEHNDVALLKLTGSTAQFAKIPLADASVMSNSASVGKLVTVAGWGALKSQGQYPDILQKVQVPITAQQECIRAYSSSQITATNLCAGFPQGGKDSCQADSGGPLFVRHNNNWVQVGAVSWGEGCAAPGKYGVYSRITSFSAWIEQNTGSSAQSTVLENGVAKIINGSQGSSRLYTLNVPDKAKDLRVKISGGSGDADLLVKYASQPSASSFDCRPYLPGNNEKCDIQAVQQGQYFVKVEGYQAYENVSLVASYNLQSSDPNALSVGQQVTLSGSTNSEKRYTLRVGAGQNINVNLTGGTGDADLYVRYANVPSTGEFDCGPQQEGNDEQCNINNTQSGVYHILVHGYASYNQVVLSISQ